MMHIWVLKSSLDLFNTCLDKLKTVSKTEERVQQKSWITNRIKSSINVRDVLYKMTKQEDAILLKHQLIMCFIKDIVINL